MPRRVRNGPPEDVGGPYGYADFLEATHDPKHTRYMIEYGGPFDLEAFSFERIKAAPDGIFQQPQKAAAL